MGKKKNNITRSEKQGDNRRISKNKTVYSLAIKCYDEQLTDGQQGLIENIHAADPFRYQILAIKHDRDTKNDGFWEKSNVKPHYHIILRHTCAGRSRVSTLLNMLGICYRKGIDDVLWEKHGVETVKRFSNYAVYLTHDTDEAIRDGKEHYDMSELITNLTEDTVKDIRAGCVRRSKIKKVTVDDLEVLDEKAYALGHDLKNFSEWYDSLPFAVRSHPKIRTIRESYYRGVDARIEEGTEITRLCVFIHGPGNCGKSYAAKAALSGKRMLSIGGGGSGKFDDLRPDHEAIIIDDDTCPNLLNMSDNYMCRAYRRQSNNPVWAGQYLIVTSNLTFADWVEQCGITVRDGQDQLTEHYEAVKSRFYICEVIPVDTSPVRVKSLAERGTEEVQNEREQMFKEFYKKIRESVDTYITSKRNSNTENTLEDKLSEHWNEWQSTYDELLAQVTRVFEQYKDKITPMPFRDWIYLVQMDDDDEFDIDDYENWFGEDAEDEPQNG